MHLTDNDIAEKLVDIQALAYDHFNIDYLPSKDSELIQEMWEWSADQLHKASWFDMVGMEAIECASEEFNAHFIAEVAARECGLEDEYA